MSAAEWDESWDAWFSVALGAAIIACTGLAWLAIAEGARNGALAFLVHP